MNVETSQSVVKTVYLTGSRDGETQFGSLSPYQFHQIELWKLRTSLNQGTIVREQLLVDTVNVTTSQAGEYEYSRTRFSTCIRDLKLIICRM